MEDSKLVYDGSLPDQKKELFEKYHHIPSNIKRRIFGKSLQYVKIFGKTRPVGSPFLTKKLYNHFSSFKLENAGGRLKNEVIFIASNIENEPIRGFINDSIPIIENILKVRSTTANDINRTRKRFDKKVPFRQSNDRSSNGQSRRVLGVDRRDRKRTY